ncbi:hypothetical protein [Rubrivirga sp.]|uniref:hypothetical protein n=1 Tax=Rubrivirga sp. TaxID=1885344 RepID=UPI003C77385B
MAQAGPPPALLAAAALSIMGLALVIWAGFGSDGDRSTFLYVGAGLFVISAILQWRSRT